MSYYRLRNLETASYDYCYVSRPPKGMDEHCPGSRAWPAKGVRVGERYPSSPTAITVLLDESDFGLKLSTHLAAQKGYLYVHRDCARRWSERFDLGEHELLPFRLLNEKGRVHSDDYVMLNPIGSVDCLDMGRSKFARSEYDNSIAMVSKYVIDPARVPEGRQLFRVPEWPRDYFFGQALVDDVAAQGYTNFLFEPVELA